MASEPAPAEPRVRTGRFQGVFRRRVRTWVQDGHASADLEDDGHRFGVDVDYDAGRVTAVRGRASRTPYSTCGLATHQLEALIDTPLLSSPFAVLRQVRLREHCTHLADMAAFAVAAAARRTGGRGYDAQVRVGQDGSYIIREAEVRRDGGSATHWRMSDDVIVEPARYAGLACARASSWAPRRTNDEDELEDLFFVYRALPTAAVLVHDSNQWKSALDTPWMMGACFTYMPENVDTARRVPGSAKDFTDRPDLLLRDLEDGAAQSRRAGF